MSVRYTCITFLKVNRTVECGDDARGRYVAHAVCDIAPHGVGGVRMLRRTHRFECHGALV